MKLKTMLLTTAAFGLAAPALAQDDPIELTFVSWGGAYQNSQIKAYAEPYMEMNPNVSIIWDESSADAVTKLRAMDEAGNLTWDLVDVVAADAMRLCDEGLAMVIDADTMLAPAPDGTPASEDFGDLMVSECFIPQIVYSTTFGYRGDLLETAPTQVCDIFDTETFPGRRALEKRPIANMEWALICDGVADRRGSMMCSRPKTASRAPSPSSTPSRTTSCGGRPVPKHRSCWPMARW
jgi:putative spermidine/putrescine transport system substrate-binding protein